MGKDVIGGRASLVAGDGERKELPSFRPDPARRPRTRRGITCRYDTADHSHNSRLCRAPVLEAASVFLEREGITVVGVASNTAGALRQARALRPDVILVDIGLGDESGFDLACLLTRDGQGGQRVPAEVILISSYAESDYAELITESPAAGFLSKVELSAQAIGRILGRTP